MINRIIEFSAENRFLVFACVAVLCVAGWWSMHHLPLDAIPDLTDTQVIILSQWDRSPDLVEDQVTYPIITALVGAPKVKSVRGFSDFGYSYVYAVFEDGTDPYWARSRTLEYLSSVLTGLPAGVKTSLGPDATGLGWVFQYVLLDDSGRHSLAEIRSCQDWYLRYHLKAIPGVAEVAAVGGFGKQYQVNVDPNRLRQYDLPLGRVVEAVRGSNSETGGRLLDFGGAEYMIRGRGYARSIEDIENTVLSATEDGMPIRVKDIGEVVIGPDLRRGVADLDGTGDAVSGIVIMRQGQNAMDVIRRVKARIHEIEPGLPAGLKIVPIYDRSELIQRSIDNLKATIIEVILTVALVIFIFLWHPPSALIPAVTIPIAVLISFIPFHMLGLTANIMSLGGIAIAIGALVDAAIVVVEQTHKKLEEWERMDRPRPYRAVVLEAVKEVGGPSFFSLLVIGVSFLPVLALEAQEGHLFKPLAYTKTLAMVVAAFLAITLDPALRISLTHVRRFHWRPRWLSRVGESLLASRIHPEEKHPVSRLLIRCYQPAALWALHHKLAVIGAALVLMAATVPVYFRLGSEFMPPLDEGALFYMPTTMPGISIAEAQRVLQITDRILKQFPEVDRVLGKAGRADTSTDPAPLSMLETIVILKPHSAWPKKPVWYSSWAPAWLQAGLRHITPDRISREELVNEMNNALRIPGFTSAWTMPVKGRIDMLTTGLRTSVGLKIQGEDPQRIAEIGAAVEQALRGVNGTRSAFAERAADGYFLDFHWKREELARYGLTVEQAQQIIEGAIGGANVSTTVEGRARYPINVRYMRDFRSDQAALERVLVPAGDGKRQIPLGALAEIRTTTGPSMIRDEDGLLTGYVYVDVNGRDIGSFVEDARRVVAHRVTLPPGYAVRWSGQFESMERVRERLQVIVPLTLLFILLLLYANTRSTAKTLIVLLAVPFSAVGAIWFLYLIGYNLSVAVWIGLIALVGVDAETGVFMLLYLDLAYDRARRESPLWGIDDLRQAILAGAVQRLRPKFMTVTAMFAGLVPIMWASGTGADVMKRIAAPLIGGLFTSFLLELLIYPVIYEIWKGREVEQPAPQTVPETAVPV